MKIQGAKVVKWIIEETACDGGQQTFYALTYGGQHDDFQWAWEHIAYMRQAIWVVETIFFGSLEQETPVYDFASEWNGFVREWRAIYTVVKLNYTYEKKHGVVNRVRDIDTEYLGYLREWLPNIEIFFDNLEIDLTQFQMTILDNDR